MTRQPPAPDADNAAREAMLAAADRYRERFGEPFGTWDFMGHPREVAAELDAAVAAGRKVTEAEVRERLGMTPPPAGAIP